MSQILPSFPDLLLLNITIYSIEHPFGQFGLRTRAVHPLAPCADSRQSEEVGGKRKKKKKKRQKKKRGGGWEGHEGKRKDRGRYCASTAQQ